MTPEELFAIEARANAATPGPWLVEHWDDRGRIYASSGDDTIAENGGFGTWDDVDGPNAYFIACSRADIPALLAEVRRLNEVVDLLQRRMSRLALRHLSALPGARVRGETVTFLRATTLLARKAYIRMAVQLRAAARCRRPRRRERTG